MYFQNFPKIIYNNIVLTDLVTRIKMTESWLNNESLYYWYTWQDHDTAENVAAKLYEDPFLYWIVLLFNNIFDPFFELPMNYDNFNNYMEDKYKTYGEALIPSRTGIEYSQITIDPVFGFQKTIKMTDYYTGDLISEENFVVSEEAYNDLYEWDDPYNILVNTADGAKIIYETFRRYPRLTIWDVELENNESKRLVRLLKKELWPQAKLELMKLLKQG